MTSNTSKQPGRRVCHASRLSTRRKEDKMTIRESAHANGTALTEEAIERGIELRQQAVEKVSALAGQAVERGGELAGQAVERSNELKTLVAERGTELRDRAIDAAARTREAVSQTPTDRWAKLTAIGVALITLMVILRRVRSA
jgi:hypothetical protein